MIDCQQGCQRREYLFSDIRSGSEVYPASKIISTGEGGGLLFHRVKHEAENSLPSAHTAKAKNNGVTS
jgi:hypothetical protein